MKIEYWMPEKTSPGFVNDGVEFYLVRLKRFLKVDVREFVPAQKKDRLRDEATQLLSKITAGDYLILLDEKGVKMSSVDFARYLGETFSRVNKKLIFLSGGAYGFHQQLRDRADKLISLSEMTFTHEMVKMFFLEQLYRAMTILKNHPYHNE